MKKLILAFMALMSLLQMQAQTGYTISGETEGVVDGDSVFLCEMQGYFSMIPLDTTVTKGGKFSFTGSYDGATIRFVMPMHNGTPVNMAMILLENAPISVKIFADPEQQAVVKGGANSNLYEAYQKQDPFQNELDDLWPAANDSTASEASRREAQQKMDALQKQQSQWQYDFVMRNIPSGFSDMMLVYNQWTDEQMESLLKAMAEQPVQYGYYKAIMAERAATAATAIGQKYTDLEMADPTGKTIKVSEYVGKNKYTLIDFWAAWCGPCRAEMPNVVKAYDLYHSKGFEVIGVSFDNNKESWLKAVETLKMPWPQMSDLKGWESAGAKAYNIKGIPANVLIDQQGNIIAKDLREQDLQDKLAELFK